MMGYLSRLNTMADHLPAEKSEIYKAYFKEDLRPFLRASPLMAGIIDREHGYSGDFEAVTQFFQNPYCSGRQSLHRDEGEIEGFVPPGYQTELHYNKNRTHIFLKVIIT
jgi:hypothetical protein